MKKLIPLIILSLTLIACSGADGSNGATGAQGKVGETGANGSNGTGNDGTDGEDGITTTIIEYLYADTEYRHTISPLNQIGTGNTTPETANSTIDGTEYTSLSALTTKASTDGTALNITLQGTAVMLDTTTIYKRTDSSIGWENGDAVKGLKIHNQAQLSRIVSPTLNADYAPAVTLQFAAADGAMSAITAYTDKQYTPILKTDIFGFTANYMVAVAWNEASNATFSNATPPPPNNQKLKA